VDAYCGAGLFSLFLAPGARQVYGIERDGEAIHCARVNHRQAGFANAVFLRGDAGEILHREFVDAKRRVDVLILDPPRTGCEPSLLSGIIALKPSRIVYISCNPATQARDIGILLHQGFALKSLTPFDMFPQTVHIETVALLES
jgi:23S rRNA (uracil1939-C5)-methyltransferase